MFILSKLAANDLAENYSKAKSVILSISWTSDGGPLIYFNLSFYVLILLIFFFKIPLVCWSFDEFEIPQ